MQDYLFRARPNIYSRQLEPLACSYRLTADQCRKVEIAYLAGSYLQRLARQEFQHADFLLQTLKLVLCEKDRLAPNRVSFPVAAPA